MAEKYAPGFYYQCKPASVSASYPDLDSRFITETLDKSYGFDPMPGIFTEDYYNSWETSKQPILGYTYKDKPIYEYKYDGGRPTNKKLLAEITHNTAESARFDYSAGTSGNVSGYYYIYGSSTVVNIYTMYNELYIETIVYNSMLQVFSQKLVKYVSGLQDIGGVKSKSVKKYGSKDFIGGVLPKTIWVVAQAGGAGGSGPDGSYSGFGGGSGSTLSAVLKVPEREDEYSRDGLTFIITPGGKGANTGDSGGVGNGSAIVIADILDNPNIVLNSGNSTKTFSNYIAVVNGGVQGGPHKAGTGGTISIDSNADLLLKYEGYNGRTAPASKDAIGSYSSVSFSSTDATELKISLTIVLQPLNIMMAPRVMINKINRTS